MTCKMPDTQLLPCCGSAQHAPMTKARFFRHFQVYYTIYCTVMQILFLYFPSIILLYSHCQCAIFCFSFILFKTIVLFLLCLQDCKPDVCPTCNLFCCILILVQSLAVPIHSSLHIKQFPAYAMPYHGKRTTDQFSFSCSFLSSLLRSCL